MRALDEETSKLEDEKRRSERESKAKPEPSREQHWRQCFFSYCGVHTAHGVYLQPEGSASVVQGAASRFIISLLLRRGRGTESGQVCASTAVRFSAGVQSSRI